MRIPTTRRAMTTPVVALLSALALTGCGVGNAVVGVHDAPAERTDVAPLNVDGANGQASASRISPMLIRSQWHTISA